MSILLWLWILCAIAALFVLFCMTRLGVLVNIDTPVYAWVTVGPLKFQVAPSKPKKKAKQEKNHKKKEKKPKEGKADVLEKLKKIPKPSMEDLKSAYHALWPPMKKALNRTRKGIKVNPLSLSVTLAGKDDPAAAAEWYGRVNGAVWTAMPVLEQLLKIPDPHIHVGVDFDAQKIQVRGSVGISLRIGTLIGLGFGAGIPALKWFLAYRKTHQTEKIQPETQSPAQPAA
ncbi:MAG: hypothetical protein LKJ86_01920 [Oscillibacter sp.]|nr:hypothetical protein [Oscillibacter sp.]